MFSQGCNRAAQDRPRSRSAIAHRRDGHGGQRAAQAGHGAQSRCCAGRFNPQGDLAVLGLTFKPNTDDTRDSPAVPLITALTDMGARVRCYDPAGMEQARLQLPDVTYCESAYDAAEDADAVVIATEWEQFRALDLKRLRRIMARPVIVDLR